MTEPRGCDPLPPLIGHHSDTTPGLTSQEQEIADRRSAAEPEDLARLILTGQISLWDAEARLAAEWSHGLAAGWGLEL